MKVKHRYEEEYTPLLKQLLYNTNGNWPISFYSRVRVSLDVPKLFLSNLPKSVKIDDLRAESTDCAKYVVYDENRSVRIGVDPDREGFKFFWSGGAGKEEETEIEGFGKRYLEVKKGKGLWLEMNFEKLSERRFFFSDANLALIFDHIEGRVVFLKVWSEVD